LLGRLLAARCLLPAALANNNDDDDDGFNSEGEMAANDLVRQKELAISLLRAERDTLKASLERVTKEREEQLKESNRLQKLLELAQNNPVESSLRLELHHLQRELQAAHTEAARQRQVHDTLVRVRVTLLCQSLSNSQH